MHSITIFCLGTFLITYGTSQEKWGYTHKNGPHTWKGTCQTGLKQSPIDIRSTDIDYSPMDHLNFVDYDHVNMVDMVNNGHTVYISGFTDWDKKPHVSGGDLSGKYFLQRFHLHFSQKDHEGSEHKIGGLSYPAELHLVHVKEGLTFKEALNQTDGISVVAVFLLIAENAEPMASVSQQLGEVKYSGNKTNIAKLCPRSVLPSNTDAFYRYEGSLTTPDCNEVVQWVILAEPISITHKQLEKLRTIRNSEGEEHEFNFRPTSSLNRRRVRFNPAQFDPSGFCPPNGSMPFSVLASLIVLFKTLLS